MSPLIPSAQLWGQHMTKLSLCAALAQSFTLDQRRHAWKHCYTALHPPQKNSLWLAFQPSRAAIFHAQVSVFLSLLYRSLLITPNCTFSPSFIVIVPNFLLFITSPYRIKYSSQVLQAARLGCIIKFWPMEDVSRSDMQIPKGVLKRKSNVFFFFFFFFFLFPPVRKVDTMAEVPISILDHKVISFAWKKYLGSLA